MIPSLHGRLYKIVVGACMLVTMQSAYAESGVTDDTVFIGQTTGITGIVAGNIKEINEGAKAYIDGINKQGGVHGRKISLITLDDKFDPATARVNAEKLIRKDGVFALFLNRGTPHSEAILPLLAAANVPLIAPSTGADVLHAPVNRLVFNVRAKYQDEVAKGVDYYSTVGLNQIGMLHVDDSFGRDGLAGFTRAMTERKLKPVIVEKFDRSKPDTAAAVANVLKAAPKALIVVASGKTAAELIKLIRTQSPGMQIMTMSNNSSASFVKELGEAGKGVIVSQITPAPHLLTSELGQEYKLAANATGATVSYAAMEGFIAAKVLVKGLQGAGRNLTREGFIRSMESIQKYDLGGLVVSYSPTDHTGSEFVELTMIGKNGNFIR